MFGFGYQARGHRIAGYVDNLVQYIFIVFEQYGTGFLRSPKVLPSAHGGIYTGSNQPVKVSHELRQSALWIGADSVIMIRKNPDRMNLYPGLQSRDGQAIYKYSRGSLRRF
jgi:hypothetical protein